MQFTHPSRYVILSWKVCLLFVWVVELCLEENKISEDHM